MAIVLPRRPALAPLPEDFFSGGANLTKDGGLREYLNGLETYLAALGASAQPPRLEWKPDTSVEVVGAPGTPFAAFVFNDGVRRVMDGVETLDLTINGEGGLDVGILAKNMWYYVYGVPAAADDGIVKPIASTSVPGTGPTGYTSFRHIGALRVDHTKKIAKFDQYGGVFSLRSMRTIEAKPGYVGAAEGKVAIDLSQFVPSSASAMILTMQMCAIPEGSGTLRLWIDGSQTEGHWDMLRTTSSGTDFMMRTIQIAAPTTPKKIWRELQTGGQGIQDFSLRLTGWIDGYLI